MARFDRGALGQQLGFLTTPFGESAHPVKAPYESVVIGHTSNPLVYRGDALLHLARRMPPRRDGEAGRDERTQGACAVPGQPSGA